MSACWNATFVRPAASTLARASATDASEMSTEVTRAPGLLRASVTVCAPTPHPASRTVLPTGKVVSEWRKSSSVRAWSCRRTLSSRL